MKNSQGQAVIEFTFSILIILFMIMSAIKLALHVNLVLTTENKILIENICSQSLPIEFESCVSTLYSFFYNYSIHI